MQTVQRFVKAALLTLGGSLLVRKTPTVAVMGMALVLTTGAAFAGDLPAYQSIVGQRGSFGFSCFAPRNASSTTYTLGTWVGYVHSETLHKRYAFTVNCNSSVRGGDPTGTWPVIPTSAGVVTLQSTVFTSTVINGAHYDAPARSIAGNAFISGQVMANVDTGDGEVLFDLAIPLAVNTAPAPGY